MLSVARCRQVLGPGCTLSDGEVQRIRDDLYSFARIAVEELTRRERMEPAVPVSEVMRSLPEAVRVDVMERAAIIEFDAGRTRDEADRLAIQGIALTEMAVHDAKLDEFDVEGVVAFAAHVLTNAARLWLEFSLTQKQRLQQLLFPQGVTYLDGEFGTVEMWPIFQMLRAVDGAVESEASPTGFEPVLPA